MDESRFQTAPCFSAIVVRGAASALTSGQVPPMARLRTPSSVVATALNGRSEGLRVRATGRLFGASHSTILRWEERLAHQADAGLPQLQKTERIRWKAIKSTLAWARIFPPASSEGWTIHFIERQGRYWASAIAGHKDDLLFQWGKQQAWQWVKGCSFIRWFTDGEHRYAKSPQRLG